MRFSPPPAGGGRRHQGYGSRSFFILRDSAQKSKTSLPHSDLARRYYVCLHLEIALLHTIMKVTMEILSNTLSARKRLGDTEKGGIL